MTILVVIGISLSIVVLLNIITHAGNKQLWDYTVDVREPNRIYSVKELRMLAINKQAKGQKEK